MLNPEEVAAAVVGDGCSYIATPTNHNANPEKCFSLLYPGQVAPGVVGGGCSSMATPTNHSAKQSLRNLFLC